MNRREEIPQFPEQSSTFYSPTIQRKSFNYDCFEREPKKDKKWSIGKLFRRKKKHDSSSSDEEASKKGFLRRRNRKKPSKSLGTFDHVVLRPGQRTSIAFNGYEPYEDTGILSDPTGGFSNYIGRALPKIPIESSRDSEIPSSTLSGGSVDSLNRKSRKDLTKARAIARRMFKGDRSSSDEDSQRSNSSLRIKSQDNIKSVSRKSRAARTERYLNRYSKDGENPHKSDIENNSRYSDESKSSHSNLGKHIISNSTSNPSYKPPLSMNEYNTSVKFNNSQRSISCDANINQNDVLHIQFPIAKPNFRYRNLSLIDASQINRARHPPAPPPRDPNRLVNTNYIDSTSQARSRSFNTNSNTTTTNNKRNIFSNLHSNNRSVSEDYLPRSAPTNKTIRPLSTTPLSSKRYQPTEQFNYLTDTKARSRRPIFIQNCDNREKKSSETQKVLDFWKQLDTGKTNVGKSRTASPQMFTAHAYVQNQSPSENNNPIISSLRVTSPFKSASPNLSDTQDNVKSGNLEDALDELEAIYNSLRLGDEDLLERAEQREKDAESHRLLKSNTEVYPSWTPGRGHLSDSYEPFDYVDSLTRKKISRKKTVDRKLDDMAYRKLNRGRFATIGDPLSVTSKISYLMASPLHKENEDDNPQTDNEPNITKDDVVYRSVKHANQLLKVTEPQLPFGIPVGPITPAANSDYLHAVSNNKDKTELKSRNIPDVVKDDLAFRNLRKDSNKDSAVPLLSAEDLKNNNFSVEQKLNYNNLKKRRAVRSLSANIRSLISRDVIERARKKDDVENEFNSLTDVADAMEIARQVLKEKARKISNTRKAFMSDTDTQSLKSKYKSILSENKMKFLNNLNNSSPETNNSVEPQRENSTNSSVDELLRGKTKKSEDDKDLIIAESGDQNDNEELDNFKLNQDILESSTVSEHAKLCEKLLQCVVDSSQLIEAAETPTEEVRKINVTPGQVESIANVILSRENNEETIPNKMDLSDLEHDYENLNSDDDSICKSECTLKLKKEECSNTHKQSEKQDEARGKTESVYENLRIDDDSKNQKAVTGENCVDVLEVASPDSDFNTFNTNFEVASISNCNPTIPQSNLIPSESSLVSDSNNSNNEHTNNRLECCSHSNNRLDLLESLKSPKLVLASFGTSAASSIDKVDVDKTERTGNSDSPTLPSTSFECSDKPESRCIFNDKESSCVWYRDPTKLAIACSYGIACAHQIASLDLLAVLGILFAVVSIIAILSL